jgi:hypothetical protein
MRVSVAATAVSCCLLLLGMTRSASTAAPSAGHASAAPAPTGAVADSSPSDAAVRHAKRTACLKEARAKKLVGAQKAAYIKDCVAR